jgi:hypothetical protein
VFWSNSEKPPLFLFSLRKVFTRVSSARLGGADHSWQEERGSRRIIVRTQLFILKYVALGAGGLLLHSALMKWSEVWLICSQ